MLNVLLPAHNPQHNPLATPPPDDNALVDLNVGSPSGDHSTSSARPRLTLSFLDDLRLLNSQQPPHQPSQTSVAPSANLAYDPHQPLSGIPPSANTSAAAPFRYGRTYEPSASATSGGGSTSVYDHSASASTFGAPSGAATSATSVSGYPSSPPPSRHRSDNGRENEVQSGSNRFTSQSPVESPVVQHATGVPDRHNMPYGSASSHLQSQPQAHEHYSAQQTSTGFSQRQSIHYSQSHSSLSSHSSVPSQSDRFPSVSSMLSTDHYPRLDSKYTFPAPLPERRMSEPSSHPYGSTRQYAPQAVQLNPTYSAPQPSYSLHRVNRSDSYSDLAPGSGIAASTDWQDDEREKHVLSREGRPSTGNLDPYSPIASTFSSSTSSLATGSIPSPHTAQSAHGYGTAPGGYALYSPPDDAYNDRRPHSSSGDSSSPTYPYGSLPASQPATTHPAYGDQSKTYSFVSLPGNTVRKRPRRRYDEIERLYACNFPGCTKSYGTLNHLNAHVNMQKHGAKRHPNEFKEMRKQWRKMKKEQEAEREARRQSEGLAMAGSHMQDLMRRRRATEPNLYSLSSVGSEGMNNGMVSSQGDITSVNSVHDQLDLQGIDTSSYGLSMNVGMDSLNSVSSMGSTNNSMGLSGGYGHHHYAQSTTYPSHGQQRTPVGVSPLSPVSPTSPTVSYGRVSSGATVASGAYYDSIPHTQQGHEVQGRGHVHVAQRQGASSPPPINRLPPDSTLLTPLHSQHPNLDSHGYPSTGLPSLSSIARMDHHTHNPQ